jgi:hypothetical protein
VGERRWVEDPRYVGEGSGPVEQAVGRELAALGWREDMAEAMGTRGFQALALAENIDAAGGSAGYYVPSLNKELRETMREIRDGLGTADTGGVDADGKRKEAEVSDFTARRARRSAPPAGSGG